MLRRKPLVQECEITACSFAISAEQREAYEYFDLPLPTISPQERLRHHLAFCSDHQLYWRSCSLSKKKIATTFPASCLFPVVANEVWESPEWDPFSYGRAYNPKELFVDQLLHLWREVPRPALSTYASTNAHFCHEVIECSNSSMLFSSVECKRCLHSSQLLRCVDCADCHALSDCERCYESLYLDNCRDVYWSQSSKNCTNSYFLANCSDCTDCLFCANLHGAKYCVFNKQYDKESYEKLLLDWDFRLVDTLSLAKRSFHSFLQEFAIPSCLTDDPETTSGNYLRRCRRSSNSFECVDCDNCIDCNFLFEASDCLDGTGFGIRTRRCAQFVGVGYGAQDVVNSISCGNDVENLEYCSHCENSRNLFACVGMKNAEYCIFNKQYSKEEYERTRLSIVALLKEKDIWGRFLPASFSAYEYNHSLAQVMMPMAKVPAQLLGFRWDPSDSLVRPSQLKSKMGSEHYLAQMPASAQGLDVQNAGREVFLCESTGRPFTLSTQERDVYQNLKVAPSRRCPEQRFYDRLCRMSPRVLEERDDFLTAFPADWFQAVVPARNWKPSKPKS